MTLNQIHSEQNPYIYMYKCEIRYMNTVQKTISFLKMFLVKCTYTLTYSLNTLFIHILSMTVALPVRFK